MERAIENTADGALSIWDLPLQERIAHQMRRRLAIRAYTEVSEERRQAALQKASEDPVWWINNWVWTYDPRNSPKGMPNVVPFDLFEKQEELLYFIQDCIATDAAPVIDKSRGVGCSWVLLALAAWYWLFRQDITIGLGSRHKDACDKTDNPHSMFWKIRYIIQSLPLWMRPSAYKDATFKLKNLDTNSYILGEGGEHMGRCGRATWYLIDEAGAIPRAHMVEAATEYVCPTVIWLSTPPMTGMQHQFSKRRFSKEYPHMTVHWRDNPMLTEEWYEEQVRKSEATNPRRVAVELDLSYDSGSEHEVLIPSKWVRAAVDLDLPMAGDRGAGFDVSGQGSNKHVYAFRVGPVLRWARDIKAPDAVQAAYVAAEYADRDRADVLAYDEIGVGEAARGAYNAGTATYGHRTQPVNAGAKPSKTRWDDDRTAADLFINKRAELGWALRTRFYKTWQHVNGIQTYPESELISIPNDPEVIAQMSIYRYHYKVGGKIQIESKVDLRKRGMASPDYYEAIALAYAGDTGYSATAWLERLLT